MERQYCRLLGLTVLIIRWKVSERRVLGWEQTKKERKRGGESERPADRSIDHQSECALRTERERNGTERNEGGINGKWAENNGNDGKLRKVRESGSEKVEGIIICSGFI